MGISRYKLYLGHNLYWRYRYKSLNSSLYPGDIGINSLYPGDIGINSNILLYYFVSIKSLLSTTLL